MELNLFQKKISRTPEQRRKRHIRSTEEWKLKKRKKLRERAEQLNRPFQIIRFLTNKGIEPEKFNYYSVKEACDILGIKERPFSLRLKKLGIKPSKINQRHFFTEKQILMIKEELKKHPLQSIKRKKFVKPAETKIAYAETEKQKYLTDRRNLIKQAHKNYKQSPKYKVIAEKNRIARANELVNSLNLNEEWKKYYLQKLINREMTEEEIIEDAYRGTK